MGIFTNPFMKVRFLVRILCHITACLLIVVQAHAQDTDDLFLKVFQDFQVGEKLERDNNLPEALQKFRAAEGTLQKIITADPNWQPLVVEYRLRKIRENIARLEPKVASLPPTQEPIEGSLPERERDTRSRVSQEPMVTPIRPTQSTRRRTVEDTPRDIPTTSSSDRELRRQLELLQKEVQQLNKENLKKAADLQSALTELDRQKVRVVELTADLNQATGALEDSQKDGNAMVSIRREYEQKIAAVTKELETVRSDNLVLDDENTRLLGQLERAATYIAKSDEIRTGLLQERQVLVKDRNTAQNRTKKIKDNSAEMERIALENKELKQKLIKAQDDGASKQEIAKLTKENQSVSEKLAEAEKNLAEATAAAPEKEKLIASLQSELNSVNDKLLETQAGTTRSEDRLKDLQKQLDEAAGELAKLKLTPEPTKEEKSLLAENDLLRGVILRQIQEQAERDEARKLAEQEINALQIKSDILNKQLSVLGAPVLKLTVEERALFKEPVALLSESQADTMQVTLAVTKPSDQQAKETLASATAQEATPLTDESRDLIRKAKELFELGNYLEAEKVYQKIVETSPQNYFALSNLAAVQIEAGKLSAAEVALKKAMEINPEDSFAYTNLGILYCRQGKFEEAISILRKALEASQTDHVAHTYMGVALGQKNENSDSEKELMKAIELRPDYAPAHFNLAVLYATMQPPSRELAKHHYRLATKLGAEPDASLERLLQ